MTSNKVDTIKNKAIEIYAQDEVRGNVSKVCAALQIPRGTWYKWMKEDEEFAKAIYDKDEIVRDDMEDVLMNRAVDKSDTALIYWLKYNHPKYKETPQFMQQINVDKGNSITFKDFSNEPTSQQ